MHDTQNSLRQLLSNVTQHKDIFLSRGLSFTDLDQTPRPHYEAPSPIARSMVHLVKPSCIAPQLEAMGLAPSVAVYISNSYIKVASQLYASCQDAINASSQEHLYSSSEAIDSICNNFYMKQLRTWMDAVFNLARKSIAEKSSTTEPPKTDTKPVFNHEFAPILEKYFEHNAYPSKPHRAELARETKMTLRQIEVWFQNHRNRAKKEGRPVHKTTNEALTLEISLKTLARSTPSSTTAERKMNNAPQSSLSKRLTSKEDIPVSPSIANKPLVLPGILNPPGPSHAFPAVYSSAHDSFPTSRGTYKFSAPVWYRRPAAPLLNNKTSPKVDELITEFNEKLHLRASTSFKHRLKKASKSWCAFRVTVPSPAPLPALLRSYATPPSMYAQRLPVDPVTRPHVHTPRPPSPSSQPAPLLPQRDCNETPSRRKIARLPRRSPQNPSIAHCHESYLTLSTSPASSRASSSSSYTSSAFESSLSHSRLASNSSTSSLSSSRPTTPVSPTIGDSRPPLTAMPTHDVEHVNPFSRYERTAEFDQEAVITFTSHHRKQEPAFTFEGLYTD